MFFCLAVLAALPGADYPCDRLAGSLLSNIFFGLEGLKEVYVPVRNTSVILTEPNTSLAVTLSLKFIIVNFRVLRYVLPCPGNGVNRFQT
jgi:hypothetical protein